MHGCSGAFTEPNGWGKGKEFAVEVEMQVSAMIIFLSATDSNIHSKACKDGQRLTVQEQK